jgi:hypothetical protein
MINQSVWLILLATPNPLSLPDLIRQSSIYFMKKHSVFIKIPKTWIPAFAGMTLPFKVCQKF